jgi:hypothetical protein
MLQPHLENCGKYLAESGKLARISGVNIVNFTPHVGIEESAVHTPRGVLVFIRTSSSI